jgi:UDP-N-acetylglucosamine enolpyruvyl transferase
MLRSLTATPILVAALTAVQPVSAKSVNYSDLQNQQAVELLRDFDTAAAHSANVAADLDSNARSSWQMQATGLADLRDTINDMGRVLARLQEMREALPPADRQLLETATTMLREIAADAQSAVQALNADQRNLWRPAYREHIVNLAAESRRLASSLAHHRTE